MNDQETIIYFFSLLCGATIIFFVFLFFNSPFFFWMAPFVFLFLISVTIVWAVYEPLEIDDEDEENDGQLLLEDALNENNQIGKAQQNIHNNDQPKNGKNEDKYKNFVCGLKLNNDQIEVVLCRRWNAKTFFEKLWKLDIEDKKDYPWLYNGLKEDKINVKDYLFDAGVNILKLINSSFLRNYPKDENQNILSTMAKKFDDIDRQNATMPEISLVENVFQVYKVKHLDDDDENRDIVRNLFNEHKSTSFFKLTVWLRRFTFEDRKENVFFKNFVIFYEIIHPICRRMNDFIQKNPQFFTEKEKKDFQISRDFIDNFFKSYR